MFNIRDAEVFDYSALVETFKRKYTLLGEGRHRIVFALSSRYVVKVPLNREGVEDNWSEYSRFKSQWGPYPLARCRLHQNFFLVMERVKFLDWADLPRWASYVDCWQVGLANDGTIKAFDYGN